MLLWDGNSHRQQRCMYVALDGLWLAGVGPSTQRVDGDWCGRVVERGAQPVRDPA